MIQTRPDFAFQISHLGPGIVGSKSWRPALGRSQRLKHLIRYVRGPLDFSITFGGVPRSAAGLHGYTDANWGACGVTRRSTGGYVFMLNGGPVSWTSRRQSVVAQSTLEADRVYCSFTSMQRGCVA